MKSPSLHLVIALLLGVAALAGYVGWYVVVSDKSGAVVDLQNRISAASESMSRMTSVRAALAEIKGDEAAVQGYFISEADIVAFINSIEALGPPQGATVSVISVSKSTLSGQAVFLLAVSVTGGFDAVMRTIGRIEYLPYDLALSTVSISQDTNLTATAKKNWHADLSIVVGEIPTAVATSTPAKKP